MNLDTLSLYAVISFFYIISPGPAVFLSLANGMTGHTRFVVLSSLGNILGLFILSALSITGLGSIILASATLFFIVKVVGALYLIYLGIKQLRQSREIAQHTVTTAANENKSLLSYFFEGFLLAVTNPKPILFFVAILPQFLNINQAIAPQFFILTTVFMLLSFLSLFSYGFLAMTSKRFFNNAQSMKWFHRVTGGLFIVIGLGLLQLKRAES